MQTWSSRRWARAARSSRAPSRARPRGAGRRASLRRSPRARPSRHPGSACARRLHDRLRADDAVAARRVDETPVEISSASRRHRRPARGGVLPTSGTACLRRRGARACASAGPDGRRYSVQPTSRGRSAPSARSRTRARPAHPALGRLALVLALEFRERSPARAPTRAWSRVQEGFRDLRGPIYQHQPRERVPGHADDTAVDPRNDIRLPAGLRPYHQSNSSPVIVRSPHASPSSPRGTPRGRAGCVHHQLEGHLPRHAAGGVEQAPGVRPARDRP